MKTVNTLTVISGGTPPQKPKISNRAFDDYVRDMGRLVEADSEINRINEECNDSSESSKEIWRSRNRFCVPHWAKLDVAQMCAKCAAFEELFNADKWDDWIDADGKKQMTLKPAYIAERLSKLISSFPSNGPKHPDNFVSLMLEEVTDFEPHAIILEAACRQLVRTLKFVPSIAEVLAALHEQTGLFVKRWEAREYVVGEQQKMKDTWNKMIMEIKKQQGEATKQIEKPK
jgi:hypothetical protein